ncbi:hypothetical protein MTO96_036432 [Rhipicephalus appendiculatus]
MCECRSPEECAQTGDCCADRFIGEVPRPRIACVPAVSEREVMAVVRCPEAWTPADERDNDTKARCESANRSQLKPDVPGRSACAEPPHRDVVQERVLRLL